jgi:hypothetical protein
LNFIVYKTTNLLNGRFYVGVHKTVNQDIFDGYLGSNKLLKSAIKKYGKENFSRETLVECFEDQDEAYSIEAMLVKTVKEDPRSYNLEPGGKGNSNFGKSVVSNKLGIHGASFEERSTWQKERIANTSLEQLSANGSNGGKRCAVLGKSGFKTRSKEQAKLDAQTANQTKLDRNSFCAFKDPSVGKLGGQIGGKLGYGTKFYTDGLVEMKFRSSDTSNKELTEKEFSEFLSSNPGFSKGRKPRINNTY